VSDFYPLIDIKVGDYVELVPNVVNFDDAPRPPMKVIETTAGRFTCDIGFNKYTGHRMTQIYRKQDGRSVGNRHHCTFVRKCSTSAKDSQHG